MRPCAQSLSAILTLVAELRFEQRQPRLDPAPLAADPAEEQGLLADDEAELLTASHLLWSEIHDPVRVVLAHTAHDDIDDVTVRKPRLHCCSVEWKSTIVQTTKRDWP